MASVTPEARIDAVALGVARGLSVRAAAKAAGVSVSTGQRLSSAAGFDARVRKLRDKIVSRAIGRLSALALKSANRLGKLVDSADEEIALKSARAILADLTSLKDQAELADRLTALEERADASAPHSRKAW